MPTRPWIPASPNSDLTPVDSQMSEELTVAQDSMRL